MFKTWPESRHVCLLQRLLECVENYAVCAITDRVDVLTGHQTNAEMRPRQSRQRTTCQPSFMN